MNREQRRNFEKDLKRIRQLDLPQFAIWVNAYGKAHYEDGFGDGVECNTMAIMRYLHDDFGFGDVRFKRLIECAKKDVKLMREGYITPKEVKDGLAAEGCDCLKQLQMKGEPDPLREWVPVDVTLPPDEDKVLCCTQNKKGVKNLVLGFYLKGEWHVGMNSNVIAWRFLPPVYEPKEADKSDVR